MISLRLPSRMINRNRTDIRLLGQEHNQGRELRLPQLLHVAPNRELAAAQTPPVCLEGLPPPLLRLRMVVGLPRFDGPASEERALFNPAKVATTRYQGTAIPNPWPSPE
jgi:hypothetical protein